MIRRYNRISLAWGIPGLVLQLPGIMGQRAFLAVGTLAVLIACVYYAKAKGRHPAWGLLGFLSCLGLVGLAFLEDRATEPETAPRPSRWKSLLFGGGAVLAFMVLLIAAMGWQFGEALRRAEAAARAIRPGMTLREIVGVSPAPDWIFIRDKAPDGPATAPASVSISLYDERRASISFNRDNAPGEEESYASREELLRALDRRAGEFAAYRTVSLVFRGASSPAKGFLEIRLGSDGRVTEVSRARGGD